MNTNISSSNLPFIPNSNKFELLDTDVVISNLGIQESYNHYSSYPLPVVDYFIEDIEHNEDVKQSNISYQYIMFQFGELAHTIPNTQSQCATVMSDINNMIQHHRNGHDFQDNFMT